MYYHATENLFAFSAVFAILSLWDKPCDDCRTENRAIHCVI